jgi:translation initiation factor IF-3
LIGPDGDQYGIIPTEDALERARDLGLDLVEVSPNSKPPVCRILDYGKYKYELAKKDKLAKKKQHSFQLKEMRYRPKIDEHDFQFKTKHVSEFIEAGSKVRVFVMFRGREMAHTEFGRDVLDRVADTLKEVACIENQPKLEGRNMSMTLSLTTEVLNKLKDSRKKKEEKVIEKETETAAKTTE